MGRIPDKFSCSCEILQLVSCDVSKLCVVRIEASSANYDNTAQSLYMSIIIVGVYNACDHMYVYM